jgi:HemY protein
MTRLLGFLAIAALIGAVAAWIADNDGTAMLVMAGYEWRMSASVAVLLTFVLAAFLSLLMRLVVFLMGSPAKFSVWTAQRRARKFFQSLSRGLIAAAAGDGTEAGHFARRAGKLMPGQPLALLLQSQAAELSGDEARQEAIYRDMVNYPETEFLGLRGLFDLDMRRHDEQAALVHATRAHALKPRGWAMNALFDLRISRREWREAQGLVVQATRNRVLSPDIAKRQRAVLLAAQAVEAETAGEAAALEYALESVALSPGLTMPALIAARHLSLQGRTTRARDVLEAAWADAPHRDIAQALASVYPSEDVEARGERLIALARLNPMHRESRVLMAEQSVALKRWSEARDLLLPLAEDYSSSRVCNLMAEIAAGEQDVLTAQLWRSRAARGGRIADWRCTRCNGAAPQWGAVCPHCNAFDTLRWTAPEMAAPETIVRQVRAEARARPGARARARAAYRQEEQTRFVRPDDPGPGAADMFGTAEPVDHSPEPAGTRER